MLRLVLFLSVVSIGLSFAITRLIVEVDTFLACPIAEFTTRSASSVTVASWRSCFILIGPLGFTRGSIGAQSFLAQA